ncbi:ankyrin repeat-containing domain protein [Aspergillus pseudocaelatus]|uniref:Ankyrin repeat-containing domain protein n=1 Tax=Aspergillus pseudocaelatus TaxID=1825620 RepID=A0ABQ6X242_9EURO|nr:ankyrin repeat-containing domain protein [Aspergillus pseudocaelatus]
MTELLLKYGSNPNAANSAGRTPLHHACMRLDFRIARILLANGADVNHKSFHDVFPLTFLPMQRHLSNLEKGWAPIHEVLMRGHTGFLRMLLEYEPLLDAQVDRNKEAPLHAAVFKKSSKLLKMLSDKGANPDIGMAENTTPLHLAATAGWVEGIHILASSNATIDCKDLFLLETPLHKAARNCQFESRAFI